MRTKLNNETGIRQVTANEEIQYHGIYFDFAIPWATWRCITLEIFANYGDCAGRINSFLYVVQRRHRFISLVNRVQLNGLFVPLLCNKYNGGYLFHWVYTTLHEYSKVQSITTELMRIWNVLT